MTRNKMKLPEEIGKGINQEHLDKVIRERNKDVSISFKIENYISLELDKRCEELGCTKSLLIQTLIKTFLNHE